MGYGQGFVWSSFDITSKLLLVEGFIRQSHKSNQPTIEIGAAMEGRVSAWQRGVALDCIVLYVLKLIIPFVYISNKID